jgi:hypothetical protein
MAAESVRGVSDGEELVMMGLPPNDSEDPRERTHEARSLAFDRDFDQDFDNSTHKSRQP